MNRHIFSRAVEEFKKGRRFLVVSHVNPEGDAVGSLLGLTLALRSVGKEAISYLEDDFPALYDFLPGRDSVVHSLDGLGRFDATFAVDCAEIERLGRRFFSFKERGVLLNLDHHITNSRYGDVNVVMPEASSAGEIVFDFLKAAGIKITQDIATNLYVAIHTDTGSFRYDSATADAFAKAAELVTLGASPWDVSRRIYENYPLVRYKLLGDVLQTLKTEYDGRVSVVVVTMDMLRSVDGGKDLVDGFVNYARAIEGVEVAVLLRECGMGDYKVSLRSKGSVDVSRVAGVFGGGGHPHASGFNIKGGFEEVRKKIVDAIGSVITGEKA